MKVIRLFKYMLVVLLILGSGCYCYAGKAAAVYNAKYGTNIGKSNATVNVTVPEKSAAVLDLEKKLFELKKFKLETIRQNLKITPQTFSTIISSKINELGLSNSSFEALRTSAKNNADVAKGNRERIMINELENKFLEIQIMIKRIVEGFPQAK